MSRIGKKPILIPDKVQVEIKENNVMVKGPKGTLSLGFENYFNVQNTEGNILVILKKEFLEDRRARAFWGLTRNLLNNIIIGVSDGFEKKLEIQGVGYRANLQDKKLVLELGFSHLINYEIPDGIEVKVEKNILAVSGIDKQKVGQVAADIRSYRPPEPYKGKGIRYVGEHVRRKAGKKAGSDAK